MGKPVFLLYGGNKLNYGIVRKFQQAGYLVYVVDWNEHPALTGDRHYQLDIKFSEPIIAALKKDGVWGDVKLAYTSIDMAVQSVAELHRALGMQTISDAAILCATSKSKMIEGWERAGLLNRWSRKYEEFAPEIIQLNKGTTIIFKPDNSSSSRGITIVPADSSESVLRVAFELAVKEAGNHYALVEEFVKGQEYTVELLGDAHGNVSVYGISRKTYTANTVNKNITVKQHYNCEPDELQQKIADYAIRCYKALGFSACLGHLEIILKPDGTLSPVEIGARSSGCIAADLVDIPSGRNFMMDLLAVHQGGRVPTGLRPQTPESSMFYFYDIPFGAIVVRERLIMDYLNPAIRSLYGDHSQLKIGFAMSVVDNGNCRAGFEILQGPKSVMTLEHVVDAERQMLAEMVELNGGNFKS